LLGQPTSASAGTILNFTQSSPDDFVSATASGSTLTLGTNGVSLGPMPSIPILIGQLGNVPLPTGELAFETFVGVTSSAAQAGHEKGGFSGEIIISGAPAGSGENILTTTFAGGTLTTPSQGSGSLNDAQPPFSVSYTSANPTIEALLAGTKGGTFSLAVFNITPAQVGTFTNFTAQNSGGFSTGAIPEPASIVMAGMGLMGVFGYGLVRRKSSKA